MFKRFKSLMIITTVFVLLMGGSKFVSNAAANEDGGKSHDQKTTYNVNSDEMFSKFYKRLLQQWNVRYDVPKNNESEQGNNNQQWNQGEEKQHERENPVDKDSANEQEKQPEKPTEEPKETPNTVEPTPEYKDDQKEQTQGELNAFEKEMFDLTNKERVNNGLQPLQVDYELSKVAREKSRDMAVNNYFAHDSPVYGSPFDMMKSYGITYRTAGENIAKGQRTPEEVVQAWMNSPGHSANILNPSFTHIGVGFVENGNHWTQQFIGK